MPALPRAHRPLRPAGALFYLDPPYHGHETDYGKGLFTSSDFARLNALLKALEGRFILSINDVPAIRALFDWAAIEEVSVTYKLGGTKRTTELLISR